MSSLLAFFGCDNSPGPKEKELPIGFLLLQEDVSQAQSDTARILVALREINDQGGVRIGDEDYRLSLIAEDHGGTPAGGVRALERLAEQGVTAVIGPPWSSLALGDSGDGSDGAIAAARELGLLLVSASATAPAITDAVDDDLLWRTVPSDAFQGGLAASLAYDGEGISQAAILHRGDAWGKGLAAAFSDGFEGLGGEIVANLEYDVSDGSLDTLLTYDYAAELDEVFAEHPGALYLLSFDEFSALSASIVAGGYLEAYPAGSPLIFVSDSVFDENTLTNIPEAILSRLRGTSQIPDPMDQNFVEYSAAMVAEGFGEPEIYDAARNDAAFLIALAMQKAGSRDADKLKAELRALSLSEEGDTLIEFWQWKEARAALLAGEAVNYDGPSGPIEFSAAGDPTSGTFVVWSTTKSGEEFEFNTLETVTFTTVP